MWILTPDGFYAVTARRGTPKLVVRSYAREDLERFGDHCALDPIRAEGATYSATTERHWLGDALATLANDLEYTSLAAEVRRRFGSKRAAVYRHMWSLLRELSDESSATHSLPTSLAQEPATTGPGVPIAYGGVVVDDDGRYLLRGVADDADGSRLTWPVGRALYREEEPADAAVRAVEESTGVVAEIVVPINGWFPDPSTLSRFWLMRPVSALEPRPALVWAEHDYARDLLGLGADRAIAARDLEVLAKVADLRGHR